MYKRIFAGLIALSFLAVPYHKTYTQNKDAGKTGDASYQKEYPHARKIKYRLIYIKNISRYYENRIAFQHIEEKHEEFKFDPVDNSLATLLIIKDKKMYLFKDGYDDNQEVLNRKLAIEMEKRLLPDLWREKIDSDPDFLIVTDRRVEIQKTRSKKFLAAYKDFYRKVRDRFIQKHATIFRGLMVNRRASGLYVRRILIPKKPHEKKERYKITVSAVTIDGKVYYAEDADGDGIAETFFVTIADGFHWGFQSGPNILFIYKNTKSDITKLIGHLTNHAYSGTPEEKKMIKRDLAGSKNTMLNMIDDLYRMHPDNKQVLQKARNTK